MQVSTAVLQVLDRAETDGVHLRIVEQLDRKLYVETNRVLEAVGGKWNRQAKAHVFGEPAVDALDSVMLTGEVATAQEFGFFETPPDVVDRLLDHAMLEPGMAVLEPSAGRGAIALRLLALGCAVRAIELQASNVARLAPLAGEVADFLTVDPDPMFDRVVMNPPFARQADVAHVMHALRFLKPGGLLVSVMSNGVTFRDNRLGREFRALLAASDGYYEELPPDAFKTSGTMVRTVMVVIPKEPSL